MAKEQSKILRSAVRESQQYQEKCQLCFTNTRASKKFSSCGHDTICLRCAKQMVLGYIQEGSEIKCYKEDCDHGISKESNSVYQYFGENLKNLIKQHQINPSRSKQNILLFKQCKYPDCNGILQNFRCKKCLRIHCENCEQVDHSSLIICKKAIPFNIQGLKNCPNCSSQYLKENGCNHIKCIKCNYQFCDVCYKKWGKIHHLCKEPGNSKKPVKQTNQNKSLTTTQFTASSSCQIPPKKKKHGCLGGSNNQNCQMI